MQGTFDALIPPEQETVADPSVIPDTGNNMDLAAIVQRLDDLTAQVKQLSAAVGKSDNAETETKTETETTETETETKNESEE